ncbi:LCP family protein [Pectinatus frisingensis]|uniref:LCP family protein n=1 Tax=Pectinatus frisingensis TaxID=865 RepID=UPI0018C7F76A|nr:LCP family protein [Pectinatus frisingensis]
MANKRFPSSTGRTRKTVKRRRRRPKLGRIIIFLIIIALILAAMFQALRFAYGQSTELYTYAAGLYKNYQSTRKSAQQEKPAPVPEFNNADNILFIGINKSTYTDINTYADALFIFHVNHSNGSLSILSIPRNTAVPLNNTIVPIGSFQQNGIDQTLGAVSNLVNFRIRQYIIMDETSLVDFINAFGGIDLYVGSDMDYDDPQGNISIHLKNGYQHLDGRQTLGYLQYRNDDLGDIGRSERQEIFLKSFYTETLTVNSIPKIPGLVNILNNSLYTNIDLFSLTNLKNYIWLIKNNTVTVKTLPGKFSSDGKLWQPNSEQINDTVTQMLSNGN